MNVLTETQKLQEAHVVSSIIVGTLVGPDKHWSEERGGSRTVQHKRRSGSTARCPNSRAADSHPLAVYPSGKHVEI